MTWAKFKEANRLLWMDKRRLIPQHWSDDEIESMADRCFVRLWGNHEALYHEVGFEEAFSKEFNDFKKV